MSSADEEKLSDSLRERQDDLDDECDTLRQLVEEVVALVKPSTSKLANTARGDRPVEGAQG